MTAVPVTNDDSLTPANCTVLIHVDHSCTHCLPDVFTGHPYELSTIHLILIVSLTSLALVSVVIGVALFCRRIKPKYRSVLHMAGDSGGVDLSLIHI